MENRSKHRMQTWITLPGGARGFFEVTVVPVPEGLFVLWLDITEQRRREEQLREGVRRYKDLVDSLPEVIFEMDERGAITYVNRNGLELFGYDEDDVATGITIFQTLSPEDRAIAQQRLQGLVRGEEDIPVEYTARKKDGTTFPIIVYSSPIMRDKRLVGIRGVARNIWRRRQVEGALKESEIRYRDLFNQASDAIFIRDLDGNVIES